jgi:hypothetical protein
VKTNVSKLGFVACFAAMILMAGSAWAANKGHLDLTSDTNVAGTKLASGSYTVQWDGSGDQVQVKIYHGKKEMASTTAHVEQLSTAATFNSATVKVDSNGEPNLSQIQFAGKKTALRIGGEAVSSASAGSGK